MAAYPRCPMCGATGPVGATYTYCACVTNAVFATYIKQPEETIPMTSETPATATITVPLTLNLELLTNALIGAFEGGSTHWLRECDYLTDKAGFEQPAYAEVGFWQGGGRMKLFYDDPENEEARAEFEMGLPEMLKGVTLMAEKSAGHFGDLISGNDDAITHDCFIQYVIFGDVIYG